MRKGPRPRHWQDRFISKIDFRNDDECWPWTGCVAKSTGYGRFGVHAGDVRDAHRVSYELFVGPIPDGYQIDHVRARGCTLRHCVNPRHLEAVTQRVNLLRGNGWAGRNSRKTHCPQNHAYTPGNVLMHKGRRTCRECNRVRCAKYKARQKAAA